MKKGAAVRNLIFALFLGIIPGWGHIWLRRPIRGLFIFILFFAAANTAALLYLGTRIVLGPEWYRPLVSAAVALFVYAEVDVIRWSLWSRSRSARARRQDLFRKVVAHYLKDEFGQAEESAKAMLKIDPHDGTALVYLGLVLGARGDKKNAVSTLKKALKYRRDDTSVEDIERELKRLSEESSK